MSGFDELREKPIKRQSLTKADYWDRNQVVRFYRANCHCRKYCDADPFDLERCKKLSSTKIHGSGFLINWECELSDTTSLQQKIAVFLSVRPNQLVGCWPSSSLQHFINCGRDSFAQKWRNCITNLFNDLGSIPRKLKVIVERLQTSTFTRG